MRAFYFRESNELRYAKIFDNEKDEMYILHPIAADRFCLAISLLEIMAPDIYINFYKIFKQLIAEGFKPYRPESLEFWQENITYLKKAQQELLLRASQTVNIKKSQLFLEMAKYINVDPLERR
jgi:hypothetical protein